MKSAHESQLGILGEGRARVEEVVSYSLLPSFAPGLILLCLLLCFSDVRGEVAPVAIHMPEPVAWTGQQLPFYVELRARGSFGGAASFSLPQIPRTVMLGLGNPTVSSREIEGDTWFVQTHEFALFSQQTGLVPIPAFTVRFGTRDGFTGPVTDREESVPAVQVEIRRPPGSESLGFVITTESLDVTETWDPRPGEAEVGAVFKRTITQRAGQMTGMAFAAAPTGAPEGVRVYPGQPEVRDRAERGTFSGERRETLTYLLEKPGTVELPAMTYVWWNPKTEILLSKTLEAVVIEVTAPRSAAKGGGKGRSVPGWVWLVGVALVMFMGFWQRRRLVAVVRELNRVLNPPERSAARKLVRACQRHDVVAAQLAWTVWQDLQSTAVPPGSELQGAVLEMQRSIFGPVGERSWQGDRLARALRMFIAERASRLNRASAPVLPRLNPGC